MTPTTEERARIDAILARDPLVQAMRERDRHIYVSRTPATYDTRTLDPIEVQVMCPTCLPSQFGVAPLAEVLAADAMLTCPKCRKQLGILPGDVRGLAALAKAIRQQNYDAYMQAVCAINKVHVMPLLAQRGG